MNQTKPQSVMTWAVVGGVLAWAIQMWLTTNGFPSFVPPATFGVAVGLVGVLLVILAWPIRRFVLRRPGAGPVDALYSTRVLLLAKAGALAGSFFVGGSIGVGISLVARPVMSTESVLVTGVAVVGAILLVVGSLLAERWCRVPPESQDTLGGSEEGEPA